MRLRKRNGHRRGLTKKPDFHQPGFYVDLRKGSPKPYSESEQKDAEAFHNLRERISRIRASGYEEALTYSLLRDFFSQYSVEDLGLRTLRVVSALIARGNDFDRCHTMVKMIKAATFDNGAALSERLGWLGFPQTNKGHKLAANLHLMIRIMRSDEQVLKARA